METLLCVRNFEWEERTKVRKKKKKGYQKAIYLDQSQNLQ